MLPPAPVRRGGCDNCAAAAAGGGLQRNLGAEARLVLAAVQRLREMGLGTAVQLLRGSNSKKMKPWMLEATAGDGTRLHGAASRYGKSEAWWRALAGMLVGRGLIASHTKAPPGQRAFAAVSCTEQVWGGSRELLAVGARGRRIAWPGWDRCCLNKPSP